MDNNKFTFIDLFSGIGGFHQAMKRHGGKCVFASEIDKNAIDVYKENYKIDANNDITEVEAEDIPDHDVLCAGFPCQAFSKAGKQHGLNDTRGTLFFEIERILKLHRTKLIILENVRNLTSHDDGNTWRIIQENLKSLGYRLTEKPLLLSPHQFGIPQIRERVFIVGVYDPGNKKNLEIEFDNLLHKKDNSIYTILSKKRVSNHYYISEYEEKVLNIWNEFYQGIQENVIGFPVWIDYFKNSYEIDMPKWKKDFVMKNNKIYQNNKKFIDEWLFKHEYLIDLKPTHRKFEWQAGSAISSIWDGVIQFRPSGIRVKKPDVFPALVAIVQIPIIGKYKRRLTPLECAKLQSFSDDFIISKNKQQAYKQFGNSVNVSILDKLMHKVIKYIEEV